MDNQTLARWHENCATIKGGPFPNAAVFVTKSNNTATLVFWAGLGIISSGILCGIGGDQADYRQIAREILTVARQHGLLDETTQVSIFEGHYKPTP
jgi:hypothetical protein